MQADIDAPLGDYKLVATLKTDSTELVASLPVRVMPAPQARRGTDPGNEPDTGPNVVWVYKDQWPDGFTERTVGQVAETDTSTDIMINRNYKPLDDALSVPGLTEGQVTSRADRYQFPVACALWLQKHELDQLPDGILPPSDAWLEKEMQRTADAVLLAAIQDLDAAGDFGDET